MKVQFIGATHEVTGSCTLLEAAGCRFLIDCGMEQGKDVYENQPIPVAPGEIDWVLATHAHIDHTGMLPLLVRNGFRGRIYATRPTAELCSIMLRDSAHIQEFEAEWKNRKGQRMEDLLSGKELVTEIDEQIVFDQLDDNMTAIWSLLLSSGYLKINQAPKDAAASNQNYHLSLTNHEVDVMFRRMIDGWFKKYTPNYNAFVKALLADDVRAMNHYINRIALETFSFFDTGKGPSASAEPERFYHGFVLGLMVDLQDNYHITSNRESGFGRYDIMLEPVEIGQSDAIILEFKVIDPESEADLNATVNNALEQIRHKQYDAQLLARGFRPDQIRAYGFAFQGKQVLIGK